MLSEKEMYNRMKKGWRGGKLDGTICGQGSTIRNTSSITRWLPQACERHGIETINDAGAGDLHWIGRVRWDVDYTPYDLFPRHESVKKIDITTETMQPADAILCRMVLNHLVDGDDGDDGEDVERVEMALERFAESAEYLFATNFRDGVNRTRQFRRLDLCGFLGEPLEQVADGQERGCVLALWKL